MPSYEMSKHITPESPFLFLTTVDAVVSHLQIAPDLLEIKIVFKYWLTRNLCQLVIRCFAQIGSCFLNRCDCALLGNIVSFSQRVNVDYI